MNHKHTLRALALAFGLAAASGAQALVVSGAVYSLGADFEGDLSGWFDRNPGSPDAAIFLDPLRPGNHVLGFNTIKGSGSVFTSQSVSSTGSYTLSFDYLGVPGRGNAGDLGGYIGISIGGNGSSAFWVGGTGSYATPLSLIDDGAWHSYSYTFNSPIGQPVRIMAEDWDGSGGVAGDAFFDNIVLRDSSVAAPRLALGAPSEVPEPGSLALAGLALALGGIGGFRARRSKA
jgi:hypothetical protein